MTVYRYVFWLALLCLPLAVFCQSVAYAQTQTQAQAQQNDIPVSDLGIREQGQVYPLKLTAVNVDCDAPQDFEFEIDNTPWLTTPGNPVAKGLGPGQRRSLPAQLDFTYTPPGIYYGHVTSRCTSCGWFIFAACVENGQDVVLKVTVADPADPQNGANLPQTPNPYAGMKPYVPSTVALDLQISTSDESLLTAEERNRLFVARNRVKAAQRKGEQARDDVRAARIKKNDCERELARLKAAMEAAKRTAAIADQDAANAQGAANAAAKALADFEKDRAAAALAVKLALEGARGQTTYLVDVINSDGGDSPRAQRARQFLKDADAKLKAAREAQKKIDTSYANRKQAADEAQRVANAAKANATSARANANAATARYNAKARECLGLGAAKAEAEKKLVDAENAAKHAVGIANYEESEAKKKADKARKEAIAQGVRDLEKELKKKRKACKSLEKEWKEKTSRMTAALNALKQRGDYKVAGVPGKPTPTPSTLFDQYLELGYNVFVDTVATATGAPTAGLPAMLLGVMQAAYGIADIRKSELTPNTAAHGRSEGQALRDWLVKNEFADKGADARAVEKELSEIQTDPNYMAEEVARGIEAIEKCKRGIAALEAKLKAAKAAKK